MFKIFMKNPVQRLNPNKKYFLNSCPCRPAGPQHLLLTGRMRFIGIVLAVLLTTLSGICREECTIGVAAGRATADGRPIIWKTRDNSSEKDNELAWNTSYKIPFLEVINAGQTSSWMGLNQAGFAILNSLAYDLPVTSSGLSNGILMRNALGQCATVAEFEEFLRLNNHGRTRANFAVLDSTGAAAIFEVSGQDFWRFDAGDSAVAPRGYLIRTNFSANGSLPGGKGYERFERSSRLIQRFYSGDTLNYKSILRYQMRDFSDFDSKPVSVPFADQWLSSRPFGYIYTDVSICRYASVSAAVIQGTRAAEPAALSTMWTILGSPAASIAVPYWPVGRTPPEADGEPTAPLCDQSRKIYQELFDYSDNVRYIDSYKLRDGKGGGIWPLLFAAEDSIMTGAEEHLEQWRSEGTDVAQMLTLEKIYASYVLDKQEQAYSHLVTAVRRDKMETATEFQLLSNYPNPFNGVTVIPYVLKSAAQVSLDVYDLQGRLIENLAQGRQEAGFYKRYWPSKDDQQLASGIYVCHLTVRNARQIRSAYQKLVYIK